MRQRNAVLVIAGVAGVLIAGLIAFGLVRYEPHHVHGGHGDHGERPRRRPSEATLSGTVSDGVRVVRITARKFEFDPGRIVVREGEKVRLEVTSADVTHGIGIPEYDIGRRLDPGKTEAIVFVAGEPGLYHFHCSVYCGAGHAEMRGELLVLEPAALKSGEADDERQR